MMTSPNLNQYLSAMDNEDRTETSVSTTMLSLHSENSSTRPDQQNHQHLWRYHAALYEETEERDHRPVLELYRQYLDHLRNTAFKGVAETMTAESMCQKVMDVHATLGASIRPNADETEIIHLEEEDNNIVVEVSPEEEATAAATAESVSLNDDDDKQNNDHPVPSSTPIERNNKKKTKKGEPPVAYITFPNADAADEAVYVLHKQQTAMSDILLLHTDDEATELQRSLEITDRLEHAETIYRDLIKREEKVQFLWDKYCRMAETILPARATNETVDRSMGDLWLAEMAYRRAAGKVNLSELHHLVQDITTSHTMRQVNVWKTTEKRAFQEPADIFGQLEELHTNVLNELALADVPTEDADARMQQIAEFHGTTTLPDVVVPSTGVDVDTYLGCDTDDEDELVETESSNPSSSEADDRGAIVLDKTSKGYSQFMEKYLFTASLLESHFVQFSAIAGYISGKETSPSRTALLIVTRDSYLHIFNLGDAIPLLAATTVAMRHVAKLEAPSPETTIALSVCQIRATRVGVKITNKSSKSRRGYKFKMASDADRRYLLHLDEEQTHDTTIACI